jgi:hypothetical protein
MISLCLECVNGIDQVAIAGERLERRSSVGLEEVTDMVQWCRQSGALRPGQVTFEIAPDPRTGIQLWAIRWQPHGAHMVRPLEPLGGVGATVIQEEEVQTLGACPSARLDAEREGLGVQIGPLQQEALSRGGRHGAVHVEPGKDVPD